MGRKRKFQPEVAIETDYAPLDTTEVLNLLNLLAHPEEEEEPVPKRLEQSPLISNLDDLIAIGQSKIDYKNINCRMLRKITPHLMSLTKMIGMKSVKESVFGQVIYYLQDMHETHSQPDSITIGNYLHTMICGGPGSGKTELAKIIAKIYQSAGILSRNGPFRIAHRDDLVAKYVGQTAIKTRELLLSCLGGVLFIDEAYSLSPGKGDRDTFGKEALDTLTAFLSEYKDSFCCIIAGYEDDLRDCLFGTNKGLERRFPWVHKVDEYTSKELGEIFKQMVRKIGWTFADESIIVPAIESNKDLFKFNGGSVESFLDKLRTIHAKRVVNSESDVKKSITKTDMDLTIELVKSQVKEEDMSHLRFYT